MAVRRTACPLCSGSDRLNHLGRIADSTLVSACCLRMNQPPLSTDKRNGADVERTIGGSDARFDCILFPCRLAVRQLLCAGARMASLPASPGGNRSCLYATFAQCQMAADSRSVASDCIANPNLPRSR